MYRYRRNRGPMLVQSNQAGLTIVELLVALTLGLIVVMAATALFLSSKAAYMTQDEETRLQESGRFALGVISRAVRQTAYEHWDREDAPLQMRPEFSANIVGLDAKSLRENNAGIESPLSTSMNGSDVLALRFFGSGSGASNDGDGTILNCAGFSVPAPVSQGWADVDRGWSIFYVAADNGGEPELRCKYFGKKSWTSDAIATGVESFQVLYGVDTDGDGLPNSYLTATAINALDSTLTLSGTDAAARAIDKNRKTYWKKVVVVKVALLLRGTQGNGAAARGAIYDLFGKDYADANASVDIGTRIKESDMPAPIRNRARRIFMQTIQVRNRSAGGTT